MEQIHHGAGDNVAGDKYELHIKGEEKLPRLLTQLPRTRGRLVGREQERQQLDTALKASTRGLLLTGMGGIGKTALALAYANERVEAFQHIAWIEQLDSGITTSFTSNILLLRNLGFEPSGEPEQDIRLLLNRLANLEGPSLLVIDNADEQLNAFLDYLPGPPHWLVLVTSRQKLPLPDKLELGLLPEPKALELFFEHYQLDTDEEAGKKLAQLVGYHTLTLEILAKAAQKRRIQPLPKLIRLLEERGLAIGRKVGLAVGHSRGKEVERLFSYLMAAFEWEESSETEEWLIRQFTVLPPIFISFGHLTTLLQISEGDEAKWDGLTDALDELEQDGWLLYDEKQQAYKMHRIIQEVMRRRFPPELQAYLPLIQKVTELITYDYTEAESGLFDKTPWMPYADQLVKVFGVEEEEAVYHLLSFLAYLYENLGRYAEAAGLLERAEKMARAIFPPESENIALSQSGLANAYSNLGRYEEAARLLEEALQANLKNFENKHAVVATNWSNLANVYSALGEFEKAAGLLEKALESDLENFGEGHHKATVTQSNLAIVYGKLGQHPKAIELMEKALEADLKNFGEKHPRVSLRRSNLASLYKDVGRYEEAAALLEKALASSLEDFEEEHPDVIIRRNNLADAYSSLGRHREAAELLEKALRDSRPSFGENHPTVGHFKSNLALAYRSLGRFEEAAGLLEEALQSGVAHFGEQHPDVAVRQTNLALVYEDMGRYQEAAELLEKALQSGLETFGEKHPKIALRQSNLANVYQILGRQAEARQLWRSAHTYFLDTFGPGHPHTKMVREYLEEVE